MKLALVSSCCLLALASAASAQLTPSTMPRVGAVSERYQSYNIEMVEVTGGRFWKPYASTTASPRTASGNQPAGMDPGMYEYRPPIDLSNAKLRMLASALGPAYVRVSGTWQNTTFFQNDDAPALKTPPTGFSGVLTRAGWKGVLDFAKATNAEVVTSVAGSAGTRDASGVWTPAQAKELFQYTQSQGSRIAASEFINEPTFAQLAGVPAGYNGKTFAADVKNFRDFLKQQSPSTVFLGPGSVGEGFALSDPSALRGMKILPTEEMLKETGPVFDAFSYHVYPAVSARCAGIGARTTSLNEALQPEFLQRTDLVEDFYAGLRDRYVPGKPMWLTEVGEAACGGDKWASTFADTFRYLYQLGSLARRGVQVVAHNTLAASDYALLNPNTFDPRPNYYAALLWRRTMGTTVLDAGKSPADGVFVFAQCLRNKPGGVGILAMNVTDASQAISVPLPSRRMTLTAAAVDSPTVMLNGQPLSLDAAGKLPTITGAVTARGAVALPARSSTFLAIDGARNAACR